MCILLKAVILNVMCACELASIERSVASGSSNFINFPIPHRYSIELCKAGYMFCISVLNYTYIVFFTSCRSKPKDPLQCTFNHIYCNGFHWWFWYTIDDWSLLTTKLQGNSELFVQSERTGFAKDQVNPGNRKRCKMV